MLKKSLSKEADLPHPPHQIARPNHLSSKKATKDHVIIRLDIPRVCQAEEAGFQESSSEVTIADRSILGGDVI